MKYFLYLIYMGSLMLTSCKPDKQEADLIFINAKVYTVNEDFDIVESFAVKDGKFLAIGTNKDIQEKYTAKQIIDLKEKAVYPGFFDAHCHFSGYASSLQEADLVGTKSFDEVIGRLKQHAIENPLAWIIGNGWDQNDWEEKDLPTNEKLNEAYPTLPVVLSRIDGHALIANDEALKRSGITVNSGIAGGKFIQKNGKLTGVLIDNAMEMMRKAIPTVDEVSKIKAILKAQDNCFAVGLTTVDEAGLSYSEVKMFDSLQKSGRLKLRIYAMLNPTKENIEQFIKKGPYVSGNLTIRCIKLFADGALGSRGARLLKPYSDDPGNAGLIVSDPNVLKEICQMAFNYNYQVATHAIGDSAVRLMLNIYGEILKQENDRRWRIEHSQVVDKGDFELYRKYFIIPSVQPTHATSDMYWAEERLGPERTKSAYAYKSLLKQNGWLAAGSDFPVEDINPLFGFYASVARMDHQYYPKDGFQIENALSRVEVLKAMTIWAARSNFEENEKGSIEIGKFADFVVLDKDIMTIDIKEVPKVKVEQTYIGGKKVF